MSKVDCVCLGLVQMRCGKEPAANEQRAERLVREAAERGAQVVCLPELFRSRYFCQSEDYEPFELAEPVPGPTTERFARLAAELNVVVVVSLFERRARGLFHNTVAVLDADGRYLGKYRKMHLPDDPQYYEKFYFTPGDLGVRVFATRFVRVAPLVCWDQWFPEAARIAALKGAELILYPTAIGWHPSEKEQWGATQYECWQLVQRAHAVANGYFVAAVNRTGFEEHGSGGLEFWGGSFVADPSGRVLAQAPHDDEAVLVVPLRLDEIDQARVHWPFLRDRRVDAYDALLCRFVDGSGCLSVEHSTEPGAASDVAGRQSKRLRRDEGGSDE